MAGQNSQVDNPELEAERRAFYARFYDISKIAIIVVAVLVAFVVWRIS